MTTPRRDFLSWLGAGGAAAAAGIPFPARATRDSLPRPISTKWDMSWADRVTGKVRAVFDSPAVAEGAAIYRAQAWRKEYVAVYGGDAKDLSAVVVFRHEGIPLVMNDAFWERFKCGKENKIKDPKTKKWTTVNPVSGVQAGAPASMADYNIPAFVAAGGIVLACNLAFGGMVATLQTADKLSADDARKKAIDMLVPGVILQPSGFFAVLQAQQAGCHYFPAS